MEEIEDPRSEWKRDIDAVENALYNHVRKRKETIKLLHDLADDLEKHHKNARIAKVAGSATGLVSSCLIIGGCIASFFTFGASLIVVGVGAGLGVAAGLTTAGGFATEIITSRLTSKDAKRILEEDNQACKELTAAVERFQSTNPRVTPADGYDAEEFVSDKHMSNVVDISIDLAKAGSAAFRVGAEGVGKTVFKAVSATGKSLAIAGVVFSVVAIPLDLHTMITSAIDIHKKTVPKMAEMIREIADEIPCLSEGEADAYISALRAQFKQLFEQTT